MVSWNDNKVVNVVSTLSVSGKTTIEQRVGKDKQMFQVEKCINMYQEEGMGGVDKFDHQNKTSGGFASKVNFNKTNHMGLLET